MPQKIPQTQNELENHLDENIQFLELSSDSYDSGFYGEAKRLALTIRVLLHDTNHSKSLLEQLGKKTILFYDSSTENITDGITTYAGLVSTHLGFTKSVENYIPHLDSHPFKKVNFNEWWNGVVFVDNKKVKFSRKDIVLSVSNQDGGGHVDPGLDIKYADLSRNNSMGRFVSNEGNVGVPVRNPELAAVRQIAHEVLKSLKPGYTKLNLIPEGIIVGDMKIEFGKSENDKTNKMVGKGKIGRNEPCTCGSGKKYKKCCWLTSG